MKRRLVHLQIPSQLNDRPARPDLLQHHLAELRRVRKRHPCTSQFGMPPLSQTGSDKWWTDRLDSQTGPLTPFPCLLPGGDELPPSLQAHAKDIVRSAGGGEVRIQGRDGRFRDSDTVAPGNDPHPPKDTKH